MLRVESQREELGRAERLSGMCSVDKAGGDRSLFTSRLINKRHKRQDLSILFAFNASAYDIISSSPTLTNLSDWLSDQKSSGHSGGASAIVF